jgi:hypothetical protein
MLVRRRLQPALATAVATSICALGWTLVRMRAGGPVGAPKVARKAAAMRRDLAMARAQLTRERAAAAPTLAGLEAGKIFLL